MKKISVVSIILICILGTILISLSCLWSPVQKKDIDYVGAIDKIYSSDIQGMSLEVFKSIDLQWRNGKSFVIATGNKDNSFSSKSYDGVRLWTVKQLFLNLKNLKVIKTAFPEMFKSKENNYYIMHTVYDYTKNSPKIYNLDICVDIKNYHIIVPKKYYDSVKLSNYYSNYIEYEPNEIIKELVNDIIKQ